MPDLRNSKMLWAAACLAFFAFLRVGEFTSPATDKYDPKVHFSFSDISTDNQQSPSMVFVQLKQSKTDQLRKGVTIVLGRTKQFPLCPVSSLLGYIWWPEGTLRDLCLPGVTVPFSPELSSWRKSRRLWT